MATRPNQPVPRRWGDVWSDIWYGGQFKRQYDPYRYAYVQDPYRPQYPAGWTQLYAPQPAYTPEFSGYGTMPQYGQPPVVINPQTGQPVAPVAPGMYGYQTGSAGAYRGGGSIPLYGNNIYGGPSAPAVPGYGGMDPETRQQIISNYYQNQDTGQWAIGPGGTDFGLSYTNLNRFQNTGDFGALNRWGTPVGNTGYGWGNVGSRPYSPGHARAAGKMVDGKFVATGVPAGPAQRNAMRGQINRMRADRRRKAKERRSAFNPTASGWGTSGNASGGMAQWG